MTGGRAVLLVEFLTCLLLLRCATVSSNTRKIVNRFLPDAQSEYEMCRATVHADAVTHCTVQTRRHLDCSKDILCKRQ